MKRETVADSPVAVVHLDIDPLAATSMQGIYLRSRPLVPAMVVKCDFGAGAHIVTDGDRPPRSVTIVAQLSGRGI